MSILSFDGSLSLGPNPTDEDPFPTMTAAVPQVSTSISPKTVAVSSGALSGQVASPSAFVTLSGVGPAGPVTKADFLYFKCRGVLQLRLTVEDVGGGADVVSVLPIGGPFVLEFPENGRLKLLEAKGVAPVEYLIAGQS